MQSRVYLLRLMVMVAAVLAAHRAVATQVRGITVVHDIAEFIRSHPNVKLLPLVKHSAEARGQDLRYSLGGRVSGDRLVDQRSDSFAYPAKKDVSVQLTYPQTGVGSVVTYVEITCQQDNKDNGNAYVIAGGIGQRFISIVLEAKQTVRFSYAAHFYGSG